MNWWCEEMSTLSKVSSVLVDDYSLDFLDMQEACVHIFNSSNLLDFCHSEIEAYMHCHIGGELVLKEKRGLSSFKHNLVCKELNMYNIDHIRQSCYSAGITSLILHLLFTSPCWYWWRKGWSWWSCPLQVGWWRVGKVIISTSGMVLWHTCEFMA